MSSGESKSSDNLPDFIRKLNPDDSVAVFTMGRFHPFHKGHYELIDQTYKLANHIRNIVKESKSFVWISPTNKEEGWIKYQDNTILKYLKLIHKSKKKKNITPRNIRQRMRSGKKRTSVNRVNELRREINKTEPIPTELRVYYVNKVIENLENKPIILVDYEVKTANFSRSDFNKKNLPTSVLERYGNLYSERVLNYLKKKFNKVILLVGSDRIKAFQKYNNKTIEILFDDGIIIQSGLDRKNAGMGDKAINKLIKEFEKLKIDEKIIETEKAGMYSGSMSRKLANSDTIHDLKLFLRQVDYKDGDDIKKIIKLINYIRITNNKRLLTLKKLRKAIAELHDDNIDYNEGNPFEMGAFGFMRGGTKCKLDKNNINEWLQCVRNKRERKQIKDRMQRQQDLLQQTRRGRDKAEAIEKDVHTRLRGSIAASRKMGKLYNKHIGCNRKKKTRKRKKKRCSKKRLKKKMICHRGTKKKLRKLRKLTKKLKLRLRKCSKKRLRKWKVNKSRKKY